MSSSSWLMRTAIALGVCCVATAGAASAPSGPRTVDFVNPGDTYDPASIAVSGDEARSRSYVLDTPQMLGGILLSAVGTNTSRNYGEEPVPGARGLMPIVMTNPGQQCDEDDFLCEPVSQFLDCGDGGPIARSPLPRPKRNGVWKRVAWSAIGCAGPGGQFGRLGKTFPLAEGVTTYTVSRFKRLVRPASYATWVEGSDGYFNHCLTVENIDSIVQVNGVRSCTLVQSPRVDRVSFRLKQSTKITKAFPAFTCPSVPRCNLPYSY